MQCKSKIYIHFIYVGVFYLQKKSNQWPELGPPRAKNKVDCMEFKKIFLLQIMYFNMVLSLSASA